ncbi:hypothetical protein GIB67_015946 [Kingdonia uniflora]|uniref:Aminotransferase-like plant mobile domain-containing protein n=1 Tax=Kingdonia uniflora TaxID=39325 RepID=A0A7J7PC98_9MAGN|nr:hypothetical protein GIB67_015946 [Kingdonia uniflora]
MSEFDYKIGNGDNQVVLAMVERIGIGEPIIFEDFYTEYGKALTTFPAMEFKDYEKGCVSFAYLETYLDHTRVDLNDKGNTKVIFRAFMLLHFGGVLFGNSKSWARLKLIGPLAILENKTYTIDFGSTILGHLYYYLDQASKQEVKYIGALFQLIEYHCYEYCQIGHHILIDNRLDDFYPRMLAWQITRRKFTGNKAKHHLALMRQQLDLRTINNIQWDPFINIKDALKREAQDLHDESRIIHLTANLRRAKGRLSKLNEYLDGQGIEVEWEDGEGEAGTSQAGTSHGRGSRGRTSEGGAALPRRSRCTRGSFI